MQAQVKIGDNFEEVSPYALLELESKDKALLLPRMSDAERDAAFGQEAPIGIVIFNTDVQMIQFYYYEEDKVTGRLTNHKVWQDVMGPQIFTDTQPTNPKTGDFFYDSTQNQLLVWDADDKAWIPLGGGGGSYGLAEVIRGAGPPRITNTPVNLINNDPGKLYVDTIEGTLYVAIDTNNDSISDRWTAVIGERGARGFAGPQGPQGPAGPQGPPGSGSGSGVVSGTGAPGNLTASPGTLYVDHASGKVYARTASSWVDANISVSNGLTLTPANVVELGGSLTRSTTLVTSAVNTLAITGMQSTTATATHQVVVVDNNTGVLRTMAMGGALNGVEIVYTANLNQKIFNTPLSIANFQKYKLNVYRNGVRIDYTKNNNTSIELVLDAVLAGCHAGDEIRIIQYN